MIPYPYVAAWRVLDETEKTKPMGALMTEEEIRARILDVAGAAYNQAVWNAKRWSSN